MDLDEIVMIDDDRIVDLETDDLNDLPPLENTQDYDYWVLEGYKHLKDEKNQTYYLHPFNYLDENLFICWDFQKEDQV